MEGRRLVLHLPPPRHLLEVEVVAAAKMLVIIAQSEMLLARAVFFQQEQEEVVVVVRWGGLAAPLLPRCSERRCTREPRQGVPPTSRRHFFLPPLPFLPHQEQGRRRKISLILQEGETEEHPT